MSCISGHFDPNIGPIINIGVRPVAVITPDANPVVFPALMDTGASNTFVSPIVIQTVGLRPTGLRPVISATHSVPVNFYIIDLFVPFGPISSIIPGIQVGEFIQAGTPYQILLGRDIICKGAFVISFDGHFTFCL